jgi:GxxExxY protein
VILSPQLYTMKHKEITSKIIAAFYEVYNNLRYGHREKTYENALLFELEKQGLVCEAQKAIPIFYKGHIVGKLLHGYLCKALCCFRIENCI